MFEHAVKTCALKSWDGIGKAAVTASWRPPLHCRLRKGAWRGWATIGQGSQNRDRCTRRVSRLDCRIAAAHITSVHLNLQPSLLAWNNFRTEGGATQAAPSEPKHRADLAHLRSTRRPLPVVTLEGEGRAMRPARWPCSLARPSPRTPAPALEGRIKAPAHTIPAASSQC